MTLTRATALLAAQGIVHRRASVEVRVTLEIEVIRVDLGCLILPKGANPAHFGVEDQGGPVHLARQTVQQLLDLLSPQQALSMRKEGESGTCTMGQSGYS